MPGVNAKGACIGPMGQRVRAVMSELHGEKIDIIDWSDDPATFVGQRAVAGQGRSGSRSSTRQARAARVIVPDYQLSLAIGKEGQNARLAARLTGWRIDIRTDAQPPSDAAAPRRGVGGHRCGRARQRRSARGPAGRHRPTCDARSIRARDALDCRVADASIPVRTCVGCRQRAPATELLRVVAGRRAARSPIRGGGCPAGVRPCTPTRSASTRRSGAGPSRGRCASPEQCAAGGRSARGRTSSAPRSERAGARADRASSSAQPDRHQAGPQVDRTPSMSSREVTTMTMHH